MSFKVGNNCLADDPLLSIPVNDILTYEDGWLYWKSNSEIREVRDKNGRSFRNQYAGKKAGGTHYSGYKHIKINGRLYAYHRVVFLMHNKYLPAEIDHIDGDPLNNRIENLRPANRSRNCSNRMIGKNNTTGVKGISFHKRIGKFQAYITKNKKRIFIGYFEKLEDAVSARKKAVDSIHGEYANYGSGAVSNTEEIAAGHRIDKPELEVLEMIDVGPNCEVSEI